MTTRILTLGETMGVAVAPESLVFAPTARLDIAGAESTVAIGLARAGVEAGWAGVLGHDPIGDRILRELRAEGVDVSAVRRTDAAPTGFMLRGLRHAEHSTVTYYRAGSAGSLLDPQDVEQAFAAYAPTLVHLTGITPAISKTAAAACRRAAELAAETDAELSLDVNLRRTLPGFGRALDVIQELMPRAAVLFVGDDELDALGEDRHPEDALAYLAKRGIAEVVLKRGANGAQAWHADQVHHTQALQVRAVDTVGAGDSFVAGYLAARTEHLPVPDRLRWGSVAAAYTVASSSDWRDLPTRDELETADHDARTRR